MPSQILDAGSIDREMLALGIQQPWAELILRGVKTIEVRTVDTKVRGPVLLYASRKLSTHPAAVAAIETNWIACESLPMGKLVGTIEIESTGPLSPTDAAASCLPEGALLQRPYIGWRLKNPRRLSEPTAVRFLPYGVWFYPFRRRNGASS